MSTLGWNLRPHQTYAIDKAMEAFQTKDVVAIQGPTGSGKSLIGMEIAMRFASSYYLVPLKALQDQIAEDFAEKVHVFKGKANYTCAIDKNIPPASVDKAHCQGWEGGWQRKKCRDDKVCGYYEAQSKAAGPGVALMNFVLYLCWMRLRESQAGVFQQRPLHIIDEAHNVEGSIRDFLTMELNEDKVQGYLETTVHFEADQERDEYVAMLGELKVANDRQLKLLKDFYGKDLHAVSSEIGSDKLNFHLAFEQKLEFFLKDDPNYAFGVETRWGFRAKKHINYLLAKPLNVGGFIRENVVGTKTLFLSATLPSKSISGMGFQPEEFAYIDLPSTFPAKNRLIRFDAVGRIRQSNVEMMMPKIIEKTEVHMDRFPLVKGIIHAPSYSMAETLFKGVGPAYQSRLILQPRDNGGAMKILDLHRNSPHPTVLLTPGMKEGVDLKNELSRFQIILKTPYPSLGDPAVKALADADFGWYINRTIIDFMQMYGRSIRSAEDFAETIILDDNLRVVLKDYKAWVPRYIMEAVRWVG